MTVVSHVLKTVADSVPVPRVFDITAHFEPSAHFQYNRRIRNEFDHLAAEYSRSTFMLGSHGGKARLQTDVQGIGVATRLEIGRLVFREGRQLEQIKSAFQLFQTAQERHLASGGIDRLLVKFSKADQRPRERNYIRQAFDSVFDEGDCSFLNREKDTLELGHCVIYQTVVQYLREDGLYHSVHRNRVDRVRRHLQQEVGRYESFKFYVRPQAVPGDVPHLDFCYTGAAADRRVEAFLEGYTDEKPVYVSAHEFRRDRARYVGLSDYEHASRRFGGLWVLQEDIVRYLFPQQVSLLYLFFDADLQPQLTQWFTWDELHLRQRGSRYIPMAMRQSQTYLETVLEGLVRSRFLRSEDDHFRLADGFERFMHVSFYQLGEFRKRDQ